MSIYFTGKEFKLKYQYHHGEFFNEIHLLLWDKEVLFFHLRPSNDGKFSLFSRSTKKVLFVSSQLVIQLLYNIYTQLKLKF